VVISYIYCASLPWIILKEGARVESPGFAKLTHSSFKEITQFSFFFLPGLEFDALVKACYFEISARELQDSQDLRL